MPVKTTSIKKQLNYIAIFLTAVFAVTFLPFNALHHHEEDEHYIALVSHQKGHSCELDEHICQGEFTGKCEHGEHIKTSIPKCFSCQFHFIKSFEPPSLPSISIFSARPYSYFLPTFFSASFDLNTFQNKGPPAIS